jgi:hypothetical protein
MQCPRRSESGLGSVFKVGKDDVYREDNTCSWCGSLNPATLMERIEAGTVQLGPTDKSYKVYVHNAGGEAFKQTYRDCPADSERHMPEECTHWVTREMQQTKFYFQHFSEEQKMRFIELLNERKLTLGYPGRFYVLPFFVCKKESASA